MTTLSPAKFIDLPLYVDSSMLSTWRSCKRKYFWSIVNALYPSGKSVHLTAGAAFAAGMEAARKRAFATGSGTCTINDMLESAFPAFAREWGDYEPPEGTKSYKTFVNTFSALREYLEAYNPVADVIQPYILDDGSPAVEFTFAVPLDHPRYPRHPSGEPFIFVGRFDMLGIFGSDSLPVIVDEKTTGSIGFAWTDQWSLRGQFIGYCWALQQLGIDVRHCAVRGISIQQTQSKIATALPMYPHHLIANWHSQLIADLREIVITYHTWKPHHDSTGFLLDGLWSGNYADACTSYGGCAFTGLCIAKDPRPYFSNYILHRWDPLAKNPVLEIQPAAVTEPSGEKLPQDATPGMEEVTTQCNTSEPLYSLPSER